MDERKTKPYKANSPSAEEPNPLHIVTVTDFSSDTLRKIIAHLEVSTDFEHFVYREAELDAAWSITGLLLTNNQQGGEKLVIASLHAGLHKAHDLVAAHRPTEAATVLRGLL